MAKTTTKAKTDAKVKASVKVGAKSGSKPKTKIKSESSEIKIKVNTKAKPAESKIEQLEFKSEAEVKPEEPKLETEIINEPEKIEIESEAKPKKAKTKIKPKATKIKPKTVPKHHKISRWLLGLAGLLLILTAFGSYWLLTHLDDQPEFQLVERSEPEIAGREDLETSPPEPEAVEQYQVAADKPRYLSIPKLGITNARVVEIGVEADTNKLQDPKNINDVGWYINSAKPGQVNSQFPAGLYDGHNTGANAAGVFYRLGNLDYGDQIIIERGDGRRLTYSVIENNLVLLEEVDMAKMQKSAQTGVEGLNIITCGGSWDAARQTYTHRVTLRATLLK